MTFRIVLCPNCSTRVVPLADGRCPACRAKLPKWVEPGLETTVSGPPDSSTRDKGSLSPGEHLGDYTILRPLGQGGMGEVFLAEHRRMQRQVAIKVLPTDRVQSEEAVRRFHREIVVLAQLNHPNVVTAYDAREDNGVHYLVMEYVPGIDLRQLIKRGGPLPIEQALDYILQAARGLKAAHELNIVHRDIKPANLLLSDDGTVKVLDLGLAGLRAGVAEESATMVDGLTHTGAVMGTVGYMAPEQGQGLSADRRADMYSLGCTLFFLLTGREMYVADTVRECLAAHRREPIPSLSVDRPDIDHRVEKLFRMLVAKLPDERCQTADEAIATLEALLSEMRGGPPTIITDSKPKSPPAYVLHSVPAISVALLLGGTLGGGLLLAQNYWHLRRRGIAVALLLGGLLAAPFSLILFGNIPLFLIGLFLLDDIQGKLVADHRRRGGKTTSARFGIAVGLACLAIVITMIVVATSGP